MYLNNEKTEFECLRESEACENRNRKSIKYINLCIDSLEK